MSGFPAMSIAQAHALLTRPDSPFEVETREVHGATIKVWKNAPATLKDIFAASALYAPREFLIYEDERITYGAMRAAVAALAARLTADGVGKGDRIAIIMRNLPEWVVAFWAGALIGAIVTPLNAWWTGPELEYGLKDSGSRIAICDVERWERVREHADACEDLQKIYVARSAEEIADPRVARLETVIGCPRDWAKLETRPPPDVALEPDDDVTIFYTSGTTGKPKGAIVTHRNIISNMLNAACSAARAFLRRGEQPPTPDPNGPQMVTLLSVPLFHATGAFAALVPSVALGSKIVFQRRWDVDAALPLMEKERVTGCGGVPTIAWQIVEHPRLKEFDLSALDSIGYGGAPSAPELVRRIAETFPKVVPRQGWGMTETSATAVSNLAEDYLAKPDSCGHPPPTADVKIMSPDASARELPVGEVGELWYRGPVVVRGYWRNAQATSETFVDGWVKTGDLAKVDAEGFLYIVDRAKDMLIRGGENIYCVEVENALYEHPEVMDAALIGLPHKTLGEEPAAVVHLKPGADVSEADLRHWVAQRLAAFKVPVRVAFWPETLPRNPQGKILKRDLKAAFPDVFGASASA
ncbi:MAG: acyl--CoA ligase [Hyphomonadaceae bacterium]|nr:acyl--CoA ligase [Hyphomonadaceae bacterium]